MSEKTRCLIATTNAGKRKEFLALTEEYLSDLPIEWVTPDQIGLAEMEVAETGDSFVSNALLKARAYADKSGLSTLADDSGILVDALNGQPGVYSARYAPTSSERNIKLIDALGDIPFQFRVAHFQCVIAVAFKSGLTLIGEGKLNGHIAFMPRGTNGHGYDPVLELDNGRTLAELSLSEKNQISHRANAFRAVLPGLRCILLNIGRW